MKKHIYVNSKHYQTGAVIIVSLFVLVLVTLLALTIANRSTLLQRMSSNSQEFYSAFQAAENGFEIWLAEFRKSNNNAELIIAKQGKFLDDTEYDVSNKEFKVYEDQGHSISSAEGESKFTSVYTEVITKGKFGNNDVEHHIGYASSVSL